MTIREHGESQHTPTPWIVQTPMTGDDLVIEARPGLEYHELARVRAPHYGQGPSFDEMRANAAFIVRACNSHATLVAAINDAEIAIREGLIEKARRLMREALARVSP
jgi:hypothetical protein